AHQEPAVVPPRRLTHLDASREELSHHRTDCHQPGGSSVPIAPAGKSLPSTRGTRASAVPPAPELPICAQATRTERAHRTSPRGAGLRAQIGICVVLDAHIAGYGAFSTVLRPRLCAAEQRSSLLLQSLRSAPR